ncbi:MAG: hypothetical protein DWH79_10745 [Planctomycetota bacterium]|nr:MAG: hypothetical protein DWH79_10745 [Planctomycetota bacterium]
MRLSIQAIRRTLRAVVALGLGASLQAGIPQATEVEAGEEVTTAEQFEERSADNAIGELVAFLERDEQPRAGRAQGERNLDDSRRGKPGRKRSAEQQRPTPDAPQRSHDDRGGEPRGADSQAGNRPAPGMGPRFGPPWTRPGAQSPRGMEAQAPVPQRPNFQTGPGTRPNAPVQVTQQLDRILDKLNAIEGRLGPALPHGQPPIGGPAPQPPHGSQPHGFQPHGFQPHGFQQPHAILVAPAQQIFGMPGGGPGPQGPGPQGNVNPVIAPPLPGGPPQGGPQGGQNPDELRRMLEERTQAMQHMQQRLEEFGRGVAKLQAQGGMTEEFRRHHEEIARTQEKLEERFQDIRRRFAEQQERIERLEQEVRRLRDQQGPPQADPKQQNESSHHDESGSQTPKHAYEIEESPSL